MEDPTERYSPLISNRMFFLRALQSEPVLTFGLGTQAKADTVEIPSPAARGISSRKGMLDKPLRSRKGFVGARPFGPPSQSAR